jgi:FMN phosphatase YigB (HAD superfamily)
MTRRGLGPCFRRRKLSLLKPFHCCNQTLTLFPKVVSPFQAILDYEIANSIPVGYINYNIRALTPNGAWHKLERGEIPNDAAYFKAFRADLERPELWAQFHAEKLPGRKVPPVPSIDAESLYWDMMTKSRTPDPWMYPALLRLKARGWKLAALSNTTVYPEGHKFNEPSEADDVKAVFDVFVSSAHVGMRKPNRDIYEYTLKQLREKWPSEDVRFEDIVFFDDIGENLKTAKSLGLKTVRVVLGKTKDAVRELEKYTGEELVGEPWGGKVKGKL